MSTTDSISPHCDPRVLHARGECEHCDQHPDWQALRDLWGIAFTSHAPSEFELPCPSDARRGLGQAHGWGGNRPTHVEVEVPERAGSSWFYGMLRGGTR